MLNKFSKIMLAVVALGIMCSLGCQPSSYSYSKGHTYHPDSDCNKRIREEAIEEYSRTQERQVFMAAESQMRVVCGTSFR